MKAAIEIPPAPPRTAVLLLTFIVTDIKPGFYFRAVRNIGSKMRILVETYLPRGYISGSVPRSEAVCVCRRDYSAARSTDQGQKSEHLPPKHAPPVNKEFQA